MQTPDGETNVSLWPGPLHGIRVLDFNRVLAGPFATQMLGDLGAEIIKIESPDGGDDTRLFPPTREGVSHYFLSVNRNKKSIVIDLKDPKGIALIHDLIGTADVIVENFRPGVMDRLGLGYEAAAAINSRIIYCAISGFGMTGPLKDRPSFDIVGQAMSGALSVNGEVGRTPTKLGLPLGDLVGGVYGPIAILGALHERHGTGKGRLIDISLLDGMMGMLGYLAQLSFFLGTDPQPVGSGHPSLTPYGIFPASDGSIVIACLTNIFWTRLCSALDLPEASADPRFATIEGRRDYRAEVTDIVAARTKTKCVADLEALFDAHEVPYGPVLGIKAALSQPQAQARDMVVTVDHPVLGPIPIIGRSIKFPGTLPEPISAPPTLGQHTDEILRALGRSDREIANLREGGTVN